MSEVAQSSEACFKESSSEHYQLVIVGAGMVGAALAAGLANSDISIALIEPNRAPEPPASRIDCADFGSSVLL